MSSNLVDCLRQPDNEKFCFGRCSPDYIYFAEKHNVRNVPWFATVNGGIHKSGQRESEFHLALLQNFYQQLEIPKKSSWVKYMSQWCNSSLVGGGNSCQFYLGIWRGTCFPCRLLCSLQAAISSFHRTPHLRCLLQAKIRKIFCCKTHKTDSFHWSETRFWLGNNIRLELVANTNGKTSSEPYRMIDQKSPSSLWNCRTLKCKKK